MQRKKFHIEAHKLKKLKMCSLISSDDYVSIY